MKVNFIDGSMLTHVDRDFDGLSLPCWDVTLKKYVVVDIDEFRNHLMQIVAGELVINAGYIERLAGTTDRSDINTDTPTDSTDVKVYYSTVKKKCVFEVAGVLYATHTSMQYKYNDEVHQTIRQDKLFLMLDDFTLRAYNKGNFEKVCGGTFTPTQELGKSAENIPSEKAVYDALLVASNAQEATSKRIKQAIGYSEQTVQTTDMLTDQAINVTNGKIISKPGYNVTNAFNVTAGDVVLVTSSTGTSVAVIGKYLDNHTDTAVLLRGDAEGKKERKYTATEDCQVVVCYSAADGLAVTLLSTDVKSVTAVTSVNGQTGDVNIDVDNKTIDIAEVKDAYINQTKGIMIPNSKYKLNYYNVENVSALKIKVTNETTYTFVENKDDISVLTKIEKVTSECKILKHAAAKFLIVQSVINNVGSIDDVKVEVYSAEENLTDNHNDRMISPVIIKGKILNDNGELIDVSIDNLYITEPIHFEKNDKVKYTINKRSYTSVDKKKYFIYKKENDNYVPFVYDTTNTFLVNGELLIADACDLVFCGNETYLLDVRISQTESKANELYENLAQDFSEKELILSSTEGYIAPDGTFNTSSKTFNITNDIDVRKGDILHYELTAILGSNIFFGFEISINAETTERVYTPLIGKVGGGATNDYYLSDKDRKIVFCYNKTKDIRILKANSKSKINYLCNHFYDDKKDSKKGKIKWVVVGDSQTENNNKATKRYFDYIKEKYPQIEVINMGVSGTGYTQYQSVGNTFYDRIKNITTDADIVTIFGSVNDMRARGVLDIGEVTDNGTTTIAGCMNKTLDELFLKIPDVVVGIISMIPTTSTNSLDVGEQSAEKIQFTESYVKMLHDIAARRSIPFLDLYHCSNLHPLNETFRNTYYTHDNNSGVHIDENGHKIITPQIESFLRTIINLD